MTAARSSAAAPPEPDGTGRDAERATPDANATLRLFIALWPDTRVRAALVESAGQWSWNAGAARERPERLHLTLHFLGDVPRHRAPALRGRGEGGHLGSPVRYGFGLLRSRIIRAMSLPNLRLS